MVDRDVVFNAAIFATLPANTKRRVLDDFISVLSFQELVYAKKRIIDSLDGDFLKFLPCEITSLVFRLLDPASLCICCLVCTSWNTFIKGEYCSKIWLQQCHDYGIKIQRSNNGQLSAKESFCRGRKILCQIRRYGIEYQRNDVSALETGCRHFKCLSYCSEFGCIAAASDDRQLCLLDEKSGSIRAIVKTSSQVSSIATAGNSVACGMYDGKIHSYVHKGNELLEYKVSKGHTGAVYCIDLMPTTNLMVSGSTDKSVKVWNGGLFPILSIDKHSDWVTEVSIIKNFSRGSIKDADFLIASKSKFQVFIWTFQQASSKADILHRLTLETPTAAGLFCINSCLTFGSQSGDIFIYRLETGNLLRTLKTGRQLNGVFVTGSHFVGVLHQDFSCCIYNKVMGTKMFCWTSPSIEYSSRLCNIACSGTDWMSGIDLHNTEPFRVWYGLVSDGLGIVSRKIV